MTLLLYGILAANGTHLPDMQAGVAGKPVSLSFHGGLAAAHSPLPKATPPATLADIQAFNAVLQRLCDHTATVPLRYGSLCRNDSQLDRHLRNHRQQYHRLLKQVAGCMEMGIRMQGRINGTTTPGRIDSAERDARPPSGKDYLRQRQTHYAAVDHHLAAVRRMAADGQAIFSGLFRACTFEIVSPEKTAGPDAGGPMPDLALYFLVPHGRIAEFESAYQSARHRCPYRLRLSGPWPPYNFVTGDQSQSRVLDHAQG